MWRIFTVIRTLELTCEEFTEMCRENLLNGVTPAESRSYDDYNPSKETVWVCVCVSGCVGVCVWGCWRQSATQELLKGKEKDFPWTGSLADNKPAGVTTHVPLFTQFQFHSKGMLIWSPGRGSFCSCPDIWVSCSGKDQLQWKNLRIFSALSSKTGNFHLPTLSARAPTCTTNSRLIHCAQDKPTHLSSG